MRICSGAGCLRAVPDGVRFCPDCRPQPKPDDGIRQHTPPHSAASGYTPELDVLRKSKRWQTIRALVLRARPLCARCKIRLAHEVDHVVPAEVVIMQAQASGKYADKYAGYFLRVNLQGLCRTCHAQKTVEDKAHVGSWPDIVAQDMARPKKTYF